MGEGKLNSALVTPLQKVFEFSNLWGHLSYKSSWTRGLALLELGNCGYRQCHADQFSPILPSGVSLPRTGTLFLGSSGKVGGGLVSVAGIPIILINLLPPQLTATWLAGLPQNSLTFCLFPLCIWNIVSPPELQVAGFLKTSEKRKKLIRMSQRSKDIEQLRSYLVHSALQNLIYLE